MSESLDRGQAGSGTVGQRGASHGSVGCGAARHGETITPQSYGLPISHEFFRGGQLEAIEFCRSLQGIAICEGATGSGKTSWPAATSNGFQGSGGKRVTALVKTKNLQKVNYEKGYNFDLLYGKDNYHCAHPDTIAGTTCGDCLHHEDGMHKCMHSHKCPYLMQQNLVRSSRRASMNYAYWMYAIWPRKRPPDTLFCDEAHELSDLVIEHIGVVFTDQQRREWNLPRFPIIMPISMERQVLYNMDIRPVPDAIVWLSESIVLLRQQYKELSSLVKHDPKARKQARKCELLGKKVSATLAALSNYPMDWFVRSGPKARKFRDKRIPGFVCKPLTARHHAPSYFLADDYNTIMMSATIGNPKAFAEELGIGDFNWYPVESEWPAETRPVIALKGAPVMSKKKTDKQPHRFDKQADVIAKAIGHCPGTWSGLIHVTRKTEAKLLADRLARRGLQDRVWVTPGYDGNYTPTNQQVQLWHMRLAKVPNSICVSWSLWTGYDGLREKINIIAKSPAPYLGDDFERARLEYSHQTYNWRTANMLAQGTGRTRRGREEDYDTNGDVRGFVAIADRSWFRIKRYLPSWLMEAINE